MLALAALVLLGPGLFFLAPPLIALALVGLVGVLLWRAAGGNEDDGSAAARIGLGLLLLFVAVRGLLGRRPSVRRSAAARSSPAS